jgi:hypothetical protein
MGIVLAFAPFIAFALVDRLIGSTPGLVAGALVSAALLLRDVLGAGKTPKVLEIGTMLLFGALALYSLAASPAWSIVGVRLRVDAGLLAIVLASIALRLPFTLQYAREQVPAALWYSPEFKRVNYVITAAWALAFTIMVGADLVLLYAPDVPVRVGVVATILALVGAIKFTSWYPERARAALAEDRAG